MSSLWCEAPAAPEEADDVECTHDGPDTKEKSSSSAAQSSCVVERSGVGPKDAGSIGSDSLHAIIPVSSSAGVVGFDRRKYEAKLLINASISNSPLFGMCTQAKIPTAANVMQMTWAKMAT